VILYRTTKLYCRLSLSDIDEVITFFLGSMLRIFKEARSESCAGER